MAANVCTVVNQRFESHNKPEIRVEQNHFSVPSQPSRKLDHGTPTRLQLSPHPGKLEEQNTPTMFKHTIASKKEQLGRNGGEWGETARRHGQCKKRRKKEGEEGKPHGGRDDKFPQLSASMAKGPTNSQTLGPFLC